MKNIKYFIKFLLIFGVIAFMLSSNIIVIPRIDVIFNYPSFFILLIFSIAIVIHNFGWWLLLKSQKYNITYIKSLLIYCAGTFFNIIMPGGVGGDAARCLYLYMYVKPKEKSAALFTVIISRIIGFHALISLCLFIGLFYLEKILYNSSLTLVYLIILFIFLSLFVIFILYFIYSKNILSFLKNIKNSRIKYITNFTYLLLTNLGNYRSKLNYLFSSWVISLLSHTVFISAFYIMSIQLNMNYIGFFENTVVGGLSYISNSVPITPGGIGIGESSYNYFYKLFLNNSDYNNLAFGSIFFLTYRVLYSFICILCSLSFILIGKPNAKFTNDGYNKL